MAIGETARLLASLDLKDGLTPVVKTMSGSLDKLDTRLGKSSTRAYKAGQQIGTGIKSGAVIAVGALTGLAGLLLVSAKEGQDAAKVQQIYATAIANSGKVSADYVGVLNDQQKALLDLTGTDDEATKSLQTRLIQMGLTGKQVATLTPLIVDAAIATGKDMETLATAVGKAAEGSTGALGKLGIIIPKTAKATKSAALTALDAQKQQLGLAIAHERTIVATDKAGKAAKAQRTAVLGQQKALIDERIAQQKVTDSQVKGTKAVSAYDQTVAALNSRFKGTAQAVSGNLDTKLKVFNERLANIREDAGQKLLPAMTKIVDVVGTKLVPAFGEFIDAILPTAISGLDKLSSFLEGGGATSAITKFLDIARSAAPVLQSAAETTLTVIQTAVGLFASLPPEIQALAVAGLTINKLTGGLVTNIAGGLISAVISSFKGLMNVNAAVVNVTGPATLGAGGAAGGATGALGLISKAVLGVTVVGMTAEVADLIHGVISPGGGLQGRTETGKLLPIDTLDWPFGPKNTPDLNLGPLEHILGGDSGFKKLDDAAAAAAAALTQLQAPNSGQDSAEKAQQARNSAFTSNPTRQELRVKIRDLEKLKPTKDTARAIQSLQNRLQNRIDEQRKKVVAATEAGTRAIVAAVREASQPPTINVSVPVTTNFNGRLIEANLNRYTYLPGQGITKTSGFLP